MIGEQLRRLRGDVPMEELARLMRARGHTSWRKTTVYKLEHEERELKFSEASDLLNCLGYVASEDMALLSYYGFSRPKPIEVKAEYTPGKLTVRVPLPVDGERMYTALREILPYYDEAGEAGRNYEIDPDNLRRLAADLCQEYAKGGMIDA